MTTFLYIYSSFQDMNFPKNCLRSSCEKKYIWWRQLLSVSYICLKSATPIVFLVDVPWSYHLHGHTILYWFHTYNVVYENLWFPLFFPQMFFFLSDKKKVTRRQFLEDELEVIISNIEQNLQGKQNIDQLLFCCQ